MTRSVVHRFLKSAFVLALALVGLCVPQGWGQITGQGTVAVRVLDQSGAAVPDARLTLEDLASSRTLTAVVGSSGTYTFVALTVGTYKLTVEKVGFQQQVLESVTVQATRTTDVTVTLSVGTQATQVTVSEQAPIAERTSNAITGTIDLGQVEDLPVIGRDISQLSRIVPGAVSNGSETTWNGMPLAATGNNIDGVIATTSRMKFGGASQPLVEAPLGERD